MNKIMHGVVLVVFGLAAWFLSLIMKLPLMVQPMMAKLRGGTVADLPAFTRLCMAAIPIMVAISIVLALGYCIYVWSRKVERRASWTGFLATTMSTLLVLLLPTVVAIYIPLVDFLNVSSGMLLNK